MKFLAKLTFVISAACNLIANTYTIQPSDVDMADLDHYKPVIWGFNLNGVETDLANGMVISKATISIKNITNWNNLRNELFINLIDNPWTGSTSSTQVDLRYLTNENAPRSDSVRSNYFTNTSATNGYSLLTHNNGQAVTYLTSFTDTNGSNTKENYSYDFTGGQISTLQAYLGTLAGYQKYSNGTTNNLTKPRWDLGLGFDADCHYWNDGVSFTVTTASVPDSGATLGLLASVLGGLALLRRSLNRGK